MGRVRDCTCSGPLVHLLIRAAADCFEERASISHLKVMKKSTKNTAKFGKLLEIISRSKIKLMEGQAIDLKTVTSIEEKAEYLFDQYKNYKPPANKQLAYLRYKQFIEGKK